MCLDTVIRLDSADLNYDQTLGKGQCVTGEMSTSDGGVTWTVTDIDIPEFTFGQSSEHGFSTLLAYTCERENDDVLMDANNGSNMSLWDRPANIRKKESMVATTMWHC